MDVFSLGCILHYCITGRSLVMPAPAAVYRPQPHCQLGDVPWLCLCFCYWQRAHPTF